MVFKIRILNEHKDINCTHRHTLDQNVCFAMKCGIFSIDWSAILSHLHLYGSILINAVPVNWHDLGYWVHEIMFKKRTVPCLCNNLAMLRSYHVVVVWLERNQSGQPPRHMLITAWNEKIHAKYQTRLIRNKKNTNVSAKSQPSISFLFAERILDLNSFLASHNEYSCCIS